MGHEGWAFSSSPLDIFSEFFGNTSPFAEFFGSDSGLSNNFAVTGTKQAEKAEAIEANLYCTLEELYYGCRKSQKVVRQRLESDGKTTSANERVFAVQVGKGWKAGTKITFPGEGDEAYNTPAGDIILALKEQPHPRFTRQGNDLHYTAKLSLNQALTGCTVEVQTLDRRVLPIAVSDIATPGGRQVVKGEGMPKAKNPKKRGNLVITYAIVFPTELSVQAKDSLRKILP